MKPIVTRWNTPKEVYKYIVNNEKFIFNDIYDDNLNLIYAKEELSGKTIIDRR